MEASKHVLFRLAMIGDTIETSRHRNDIIDSWHVGRKYLQHMLETSCKDHYCGCWALEIDKNHNSNSTLGGHPASSRECTRDHRGADLVRRGKLSSAKPAQLPWLPWLNPTLESWEIGEAADGRRHAAYDISDKLSSLLGGATAYSPVINRESIASARLGSKAGVCRLSGQHRRALLGSLMTGRQRANARDCDTGLGCRL